MKKKCHVKHSLKAQDQIIILVHAESIPKQLVNTPNKNNITPLWKLGITYYQI